VYCSADLKHDDATVIFALNDLMERLKAAGQLPKRFIIWSDGACSSECSFRAYLTLILLLLYPPDRRIFSDSMLDIECTRTLITQYAKTCLENLSLHVKLNSHDVTAVYVCA
jgi:hypothetical protein